MTASETTALKTMLFALADDEFIIGHRMSEWTGLGPIIEEDIAFSSMAQDEMGHALGLYSLLHQMGEDEPDTLAFLRPADAFHNSICVELSRGDYAFSLIRQLLYDGAEAERFEALTRSSFPDLANLAAKIVQEERYHWIHNTMLVQRLAKGTEESRIRMQSALSELFPYSLGLFEPFDGNDLLVAANIAPDENTMRQRWLNRMCPLLLSYGLAVPAHQEGDNWTGDVEAVFGGRSGRHTEHLMNILDALQLLRKADPEAAW